MNEIKRKLIARLSFWALVGLMMMVMAALFSSCRSIQYVPVETVRTEVQYKDRLQRDSIHIQDSIFMYMNGDTIFRDRWHTEYKDRQIRDTTYINKVDSVYVPYPVEKQLTKWQSMKLELGGWAFGAVIAMLLIIIGWLVYRWKIFYRKGGEHVKL